MRGGFPGYMSAALPTQEAFDPTDVAGVAAWYDATDFTTITKNGSNRVQTWADKAGSTNSLTTSSSEDRPTWTASGQNSLPVVRFDGTEQMDVSAGLFSVPNGASTMFIVSKRAAESSGAETIFNMSDATAADFFMIYSATPGTITYKSRDGAGGSLSLGSLTLTNFNILRGRRSGTTQAIAANGSTEAINASGVSSAGIDSGDVGVSNADSLFLTGDVAEVLIYSASLSTGDISSVETYLSNKWNIGLL